jgi:hypothetical protein
MRPLNEKLTYDQLFRMSDPKRMLRSFHVKGPPLEIDSYQDAVYYAFNFKSTPSTTGLRHRGYVKFLRPKLGGQKPLQHLNCIVDCTCPDFRYRWAWANKQRGASRVGPQSLNQALNRAPRRTNPTSKPGLCKHVLAAREYIYGLLSSFPSNEPDTADKLNKLTQFATKRWINMDAEMDAARDRQARIAAARNMRNAGQPAPQDIPLGQEAPGGDEEPREPGDEEAYQNIVPPEIADAPELQRLPPPPVSFATKVRPPSERGRTFPTAKAKDRIQKGTPATPPSKIGDRAAKAGYNSPAAYNFARRQGLGDSLGYSTVKNETNDVVMTNGQKDMNALTEAQRIISELEQDELASLRAAGQEDDQDSPEALPPAGDMGGGDEFNDGAADVPPQGGGAGAGGMGGDLPPSEPPVSDSAVGADSEGQVALALLREIADYLGQLASALAPAPEPEDAVAGGGEGGGEFGGEPEDGEEISVEDPSDEAESESEGEHEEEGEVERAEEEDEEEKEAARS